MPRTLCLGILTFLKITISLGVQPQLVLAKYYRYYKMRTLQEMCFSLKAIGTHGGSCDASSRPPYKYLHTYIYMSGVFAVVHSTSNRSRETRKPEMVLSFYVYVHLVFKVYTCMSYLRNVMCVKWELECKEKKQNPSINHWWKTVEITLNSNNEII